jgi:Zn-dependent alcohol dehydrogenase
MGGQVANKSLSIEVEEVALPQAMEVCIKILFTSLFHTDVYFWSAKVSTDHSSHSIEMFDAATRS